ncbi:unnamed protein product, partial [Symbiodinium sp. CCMP2456]
MLDVSENDPQDRLRKSLWSGAFRRQSRKKLPTSHRLLRQRGMRPKMTGMSVRRVSKRRRSAP